MCVTRVFVDQFPDLQTHTFRQTSYCQYGQPGRPCSKHSTVEEPVRFPNFGEPTTEHMMTSRQFLRPQPRPQTPPHSPNGHHRHSSAGSSGHSGHHRKHSHSKRTVSPLRPTKQHRKERIIIVDSPPTPRTPPQMYNQTFTAPSSPVSPRFRNSHEGHRERGRPVIVDERPLRRAPSISAVVSDRPRRSHSIDRNRTRRTSGAAWDSPSSSHTSFNSRLRQEEEEIERIRLAEIQRQLRLKDIEAAERSKQAEIKRQLHLKDIASGERRKEAEIERRVQRQLEEQREAARIHAQRQLDEQLKAARIRAQDEEIKRRPAVPLAPMPPPPARRRQVVTIVDQADMLPEMMGGLGINDRIDERVKEEQEEAMKARLRERQLPKRRFSVGPGYRRHRVAYDDGMYRWE